MLSPTTRRSVNRIALYVMRGDVIPLLSSRGRPRLLNAEDLECLRLLFRKGPDLYLDELAESMTTFLGRDCLVNRHCGIRGSLAVYMFTNLL